MQLDTKPTIVLVALLIVFLLAKTGCHKPDGGLPCNGLPPAPRIEITAEQLQGDTFELRSVQLLDDNYDGKSRRTVVTSDTAVAGKARAWAPGAPVGARRLPGESGCPAGDDLGLDRISAKRDSGRWTPPDAQTWANRPSARRRDVRRASGKSRRSRAEAAETRPAMKRPTEFLRRFPAFHSSNTTFWERRLAAPGRDRVGG